MYQVKFYKFLGVTATIILTSINFVTSSQLQNISMVESTPTRETKLEGNTDSNSSMDNRMGFNFQHAHAYGTNEGSLSYSGQNSYAAQAGVLNPDGSYDSIYNDAQSGGNAYSSGVNAPQTWAKTDSQAEPDKASGSGEAQMSGGEGSAYETGFSNNQAIPLDLSGSVLLSNLNRKTEPSNNPGKNSTSAITGKLQTNQSSIQEENPKKPNPQNEKPNTINFPKK